MARVAVSPNSVAHICIQLVLMSNNAIYKRRFSMKEMKVPFGEFSLRAFVDDNNQGFVAIKPICEAIGVAAWRQEEKIKSDTKFSYQHMLSTGADGKQYKMICLPIDEIRGWLYTINNNKVKPEVAPLLLEFQKEVHKALNLYFNGYADLPIFKALCDKIEMLMVQLQYFMKKCEELESKYKTLEESVSMDRHYVASDAGRMLNRSKLRLVN